MLCALRAPASMASMLSTRSMQLNRCVYGSVLWLAMCMMQAMCRPSMHVHLVPDAGTCATRAPPPSRTAEHAQKE